MRAISLKVPENLDARLSAMARRRRRSKSAIVRESLERTLAEEERDPETPLFERMRHLVGCAKGRPADLSTNKEYLKDLGKR
jgi:hypothetical protein